MTNSNTLTLYRGVSELTEEEMKSMIKGGIKAPLYKTFREDMYSVFKKEFGIDLDSSFEKIYEAHNDAISPSLIKELEKRGKNASAYPLISFSDSPKFAFSWSRDGYILIAKVPKEQICRYGEKPIEKTLLVDCKSENKRESEFVTPNPKAAFPEENILGFFDTKKKIFIKNPANQIEPDFDLPDSHPLRQMSFDDFGIYHGPEC